MRYDTNYQYQYRSRWSCSSRVLSSKYSWDDAKTKDNWLGCILLQLVGLSDYVYIIREYSIHSLWIIRVNVKLSRVWLIVVLRWSNQIQLWSTSRGVSSMHGSWMMSLVSYVSMRRWPLITSIRAMSIRVNSSIRGLSLVGWRRTIAQFVCSQSIM